jgi:Chaperone of endosialidase
MGGGGGILGGLTQSIFGKPQTVATPNYTGAAQDTAAGNLANAQNATNANRVNQNTPYGNLSYTQTTDANGNPVWTASQSMPSGLQSAVNGNFGVMANTYANPLTSPTFNSVGDMPSMNYYGSRLNQQQFNPATQLLPLPQYNVNTQIDQSQLPSYGINPGQTYSDAIMQRLQPAIQRDRQSLSAQLANQGIAPGTKAYETAMTLQGQKENDAMTSAVVGGMNTGLQANQQAFGQGATQVGLNLTGQEQSFTQPLRVNAQNMGANELAYNQQIANQSLGMNAQNQAFNQALSKYMAPAQVGSLLKGIATPSYVTPYNQQATPGTDYLSAMGLTNQSNQANANAQNAQNNALLSGLFTLGGSLISSPTGTLSKIFSDIRMKENIELIGYTENGLNVYDFDYKPEYKDIAGHGRFRGVMAQEVEKIIPYAVITLNDGYKMVDYSLLGA